MVDFKIFFQKIFGLKNYKQFLIVDDIDAINFKKELDAKKFVITDKNKFKWIYFRCPCGCKNIIQLNLMKSCYPNWKITINKDKTINIYPSVINTKCNSHFWINKNRVVWHKLKF